MRQDRSSVLLVVLTRLVAGLEIATPHGVGPEFAKFFQSRDSFTCISNPSITLSFSQINDDYCDCPDGSDEPGTSACAYLSPLSPGIVSNSGRADENTSLVLPGFYCENKGHIPTYVPFTHVNDGVCDHELCCDGTDEWATVGRTKCEDKCKEIGKEWRKLDEQRQKSFATALKKRQDLINESVRIKQEITNQIENLSISIQAMEIKVADLKKEKEEIEKREHGKLIGGAGAGGKAAVLAGLAKARLNELRESLRAIRDQRDAQVTKLTELEQILRTFKEEYNPNFNDEGVKRAVQSWENYEARGSVRSIDEVQEKEFQAILEGDDAIDWEEYESGDVETDVDILYRFEQYLPISLHTWLNQQVNRVKAFLIDNGILAATTPPTAENKAIKEANDRVTAAENDLTNQKRKKQEQEDMLAKDYGQDDIFRALEGKCTSLDIGEYIYELCWMKDVHQKPKKGGMSHKMGGFKGFSTVTVDEDVKPDGKGLGSGERLVMNYENGAHCWNGPLRSTSVVMACAETEEIWKVIEEEKCVYRMEVGTPAVCNGVELQSTQQTRNKDEL